MLAILFMNMFSSPQSVNNQEHLQRICIQSPFREVLSAQIIGDSAAEGFADGSPYR